MWYATWSGLTQETPMEYEAPKLEIVGSVTELTLEEGSKPRD